MVRATDELAAWPGWRVVVAADGAAVVVGSSWWLSGVVAVPLSGLLEEAVVVASAVLVPYVSPSGPAYPEALVQRMSRWQLVVEGG
jgi:hypothetical protein